MKQGKIGSQTPAPPDTSPTTQATSQGYLGTMTFRAVVIRVYTRLRRTVNQVQEVYANFGTGLGCWGFFGGLTMARPKPNRHREYDRQAYLKQKGRERTGGISAAEVRRICASEELSAKCLHDTRWPDGVRCPDCDSARITRLRCRERYQCYDCAHEFSPTSMTWLHKTRTPPSIWIWIAYRMLSSKSGVAANELRIKEHLDSETVWHICHYIREAMYEDLLRSPKPSGVVEVDEAYFRHGRKKYTLIGVIEKSGTSARFETIPDTSKAVMHDFILRNTGPSLAEIHTDGHKSYIGIDMVTGAKHVRIDHSAQEYTLGYEKGGATTNSIESYWAALRGAKRGTYRHMSGDLLPLYAAEVFWRRSHAGNADAFNELLRLLMSAPEHLLEAQAGRLARREARRGGGAGLAA